MSVNVRAAIYVRQSIQHAEGIERAISRCSVLVTERGWVLAETYADNNVSASKSRDSAEWASLLAACKAGRVDVVVGVDMDRLIRSIQDLAKLIDLGVRVLTVDGEIDLTSADGEFRATMLAGIARFETRRKAERQLRANEWKIANGRPIPGKRRFGFVPGNAKAHPTEAAKLISLFNRVKAGEKVSVLAAEIGKSTVTFRDMLKNRAYIGEVPKGVYENGKLVRREWTPAHSDVDRIIDPELFAEVQAILADPARRTNPGGQRKHLASGIARCGECGGTLSSRAQNYLCVADLSHPCIRKTVLDEAIMWEVFTFLTDSPEAEGGDVLALADELRTLTERRVTVQEMALWEGADVAALRKEIARLAREIERVGAALDAARSERVAADVVARIRAALPSDMTDEEGATWWEAEWASLSFAEKRELARCLDIRVSKGRGLERVKIVSKTGS